MYRYLYVLLIWVLLSLFLSYLPQASWYYEDTYECLVSSEGVTVHPSAVAWSKNCFTYMMELAGIKIWLGKQINDIDMQLASSTLKNRAYLEKTKNIILQKIGSTNEYLRSMQSGIKIFETKLFQDIRKKYLKSLISVRNKISDQNTLLYGEMKNYINSSDKTKLKSAQNIYQQNYYKIVIINGILGATNLDEFMPMLDMYNKTFVNNNK